VNDVLTYLPRALQIALLAPFPIDWAIFYAGETRSVFRIFMTGEMFLAYLSFFFLGVYLFLNRAKLEVFVSLAYVLPTLTIYGLATPHVGILCRFRYPFFVLLMTMGFALAIKLWLYHRASG
jgi:hypothetical protein